VAKSATETHSSLRAWSRASLCFTVLLAATLLGLMHIHAPPARTDLGIDYDLLNQHVQTIAARPHTMGSDANREVRDYIVAQLESYGLETEIQRRTVVYEHPRRTSNRVRIGDVENIIARLPGAENEDSLVLMSHYDSRPDGPGAGDAASGVAAVLEAARLLSQGLEPVRDVVFLLTDGEEMGLLGAQAFFRHHREAQYAGLVLNFEARGSSGPSNMFETSNGNEWLIRELASVTPDLMATSLSFEVYQRMPNDTDLTIAKAAGKQGLNFAFVDDYFDYHAMVDTPANLDPSTLAHQAAYAVTLGRHFANLSTIAGNSSNATYFNLIPGTFIVYSQTTAQVLAIVVLALGLIIFMARWRHGAISLSSTAYGVLGLLVLLLLLSNFFEGLIDWQRGTQGGLTRVLAEGATPLLGYSLLAAGFCAWFLTALADRSRMIVLLIPLLAVILINALAGRLNLQLLLILGGLAAALWWLRDRCDGYHLRIAGLCLWWVLAAVLAYTIPNASYILVWPLASVLLLAILSERLGWSKWELGTLASQLAGSIVPLAMLVPLVYMLYLALGVFAPQIPMILLGLALVLLTPLMLALGRPARGLIAYLLMVAGLLVMIPSLAERSPNSRHPAPETLFLAVDVANDRSYWASTDSRPEGWVREVLGESPDEAVLEEIIPGAKGVLWSRAAEIGKPPVAVSVQSPESEADQPDSAPPGVGTLRIIEDIADTEQRVVTMQLRSPVGAEYISLRFSPDANYLGATANGLPIPGPDLDDEQWWAWRWYGLPADGGEITLMLEPGQSFSAHLIEVSYHMPETAPPRPTESMRTKYSLSDSTVYYQRLGPF
jgi:hypothetical protein